MIIFPTTFNPVEPSVSNIVKKHKYLLFTNPLSSEIFANTNIVIANKRCKNLKELMLRGDPYNVKTDITNNFNGYVKCDKKCDSCDNMTIDGNSFICEATGKEYKIRRNLSCNTENVIYMAICTNCKKQGIGSTTSWKPRLRNYKAHIKNLHSTCNIVKHFINCCSDVNTPCKFLKFMLIDSVTNTENFDKVTIENLLLKKEQFWIGTLVTMHKGLNSSHDWKRKKRIDREKN